MTNAQSPEESVAAAFERYFFLTPADTPGMLRIVNNIRYQVYVREFAYEPENDEAVEKDEYDEQSRHCLLIHKSTSIPAGCIRLISPRERDAPDPLPFELHCKDAIDPKLFDVEAARGTFSEISRLAVLAQFRRRKNDEHSPFTISEADMDSELGKRAFPYIPVSLVLAIFATFMNTDCDIAFCMMEPRLARLLSRFGIVFTQVGDLIDYHGLRAPFIMHRDDFLPPLKPEVRELYDLIARQLRENARRIP